ncbi:MAG: thiamine-phosphate kinase [Gemmatimonadales bacterium]
MAALPTPLGPGEEFDRIRAIASALGDRAAGLGDDCAFLADGWCASIDVSTEGIHFRRAWLSPSEIGWRAAMAALSDLAAVGAEPVGLLVALSAPHDEPADHLTQLMTGVAEAAREVGALVLGGDLTASPLLSVAITVLGRTEHPVKRRGARPGDGLWVTGTLGGARAALEAWEAGREPPAVARVRFAHPRARVEAGRELAIRGATAMLDLSDGLGGDAWHLARASGVGIRIDLDRLPVGPGVVGGDRVLTAARGGEDYELLVALPPAFGAAEAQAFATDTGTPLTRIGAVASGADVVFVRGDAPVRVTGYDHFA